VPCTIRIRTKRHAAGGTLAAAIFVPSRDATAVARACGRRSPADEYALSEGPRQRFEFHLRQDPQSIQAWVSARRFHGRRIDHCGGSPFDIGTTALIRGPRILRHCWKPFKCRVLARHIVDYGGYLTNFR
jgi:hypothetical protein